MNVYLVGHSHIDAVWLWDKEETKSVCKNTFERVLNLLDKHDDFYYCQSTAQFYEWIEKETPEIFKRIKQHVKNGKWEIVGGMWTESDANLPSGESLARQILYGKNYFKDKFNVDVKVGWLPDTFGYCWTLPQIFKKAGIDYFLTSKLFWETTLAFPHVIFWWQSPDGSKVLSCVTPGGYNNTNFKAVRGQCKSALHKQPYLPSILLPYGEGDHGGGLNDEMINDVFKNNDKSLKISFTTALQTFKSIEKDVGKSLPIYNDELYLNTHQGTYTTQGRIKKLNRKGEVALDLSERFATLAYLFGERYPYEAFYDAWKKLLFNQFHDDLAGSSIEKVYKDVENDFNHIFNITDNVIYRSLKKISSNINTQENSIVVFNPSNWSRTGEVKIPLASLKCKNVCIEDEKGTIIPHQIIEEDKENYLLFLANEIPEVGYKTYQLKQNEERSKITDTTLKVKDYILENEFFRVELSSRTGLVTSVYDKIEQEEVLAKANPNLFYVYQDETLTEGAWNIHIGKLKKLGKPLSVKVIEEGPVRVTIEATYVYKEENCDDSLLKVKTTLYQGIPQIFFDLYINWHAKYKLVKVGFKVKGHAEFVTYEIPYGYIKRRVSDSEEATPQEREKEEVPAQKWVDYTPMKGKYGISLLNDCKYGFDVKNDVLRMTLLRSVEVPDPLTQPEEGLKAFPKTFTDQGEHKIRYALYPHKNNWKEFMIPQVAYDFNTPLQYVIENSHDGKFQKTGSFISVNNVKNVIISAIKKSERSDAIIIRLYETNGQESSIQISSIFPLNEVWETDLLENPITKIKLVSENLFSVDVKKFEIKTLSLKFEREGNS